MRALDDVKIAVIGLGYVGLPLAVEFGKRYPTIGFDVKDGRIAELERGHDSTLETTADAAKGRERGGGLLVRWTWFSDRLSWAPAGHAGGLDDG